MRYPRGLRPFFFGLASPMIAVILLVGLWAGIQNALAGGGSFVTLPVLMLGGGLSPLAANLTSCVALFPGQVASGVASWRLAGGVGRLSFRALVALSLVGGVVGGVLLLVTPSTLFSRFVPWLVLFATVVFAWGSFGKRDPARTRHLSPAAAGVAQFLIAIYGGYFGGGIGFMMMAALTMAGVETRTAIATKNALAAVMNASAVALFVFSAQVHWPEAIALGVGAVAGGWAGAWALRRIHERWLRVGVVALGLVLTIGLFVRPF